MRHDSPLLWGVFALVIGVMLALDLGIVNRKAHVIRLREAFLWSLVWTSLALSFCGLVNFWMGSQKALEFLTGYLVEESLSIDNLFVFLLLFAYFRVPKHYEHTILFWGIIGVLFTRGIFITMGVALIERFHWVLYIFGAVLVYTAFKLALEKDKEVRPEKNIFLKLFRKLMPITPDYHGSRFFVRHEGKWSATPLFVVLLVVESTDILFAVDSVPAVLGITHDPFIVYTSNVFAILGLRSLFFLLSGIMGLFHQLHYGLAFILAFIGVKMLLSEYVHIPIGIALAVIGATLAFSIVASLIWPKVKKE